MPRSEATRRAQNKYDAANRMMLGARVTKADGERFRAICEASGQTVNAALVEYVRACLERGSLPHPAAPATASAAEQPRRKDPAPEQPAPKSTEQPKRNTPEELLEQQKKKLAEQTEEIKRREAEKAEAEARKEAERQQREKEAQEFLRQFVEQFNREQARLAGEGKPFKEWRDLYDQDQSDILHAASFRDYREVSTLQELTPRERKARGFPLFDEKPKNF